MTIRDKAIPAPAFLKRLRAAELVRFAMSTGISALLSFGVPVVLHEGFGVGQQRAVAIGFALAYVTNLLLLKAFVYRSPASWRAVVPRYVVVNGLFRLAEYGAFGLLVDRFALDYRLVLLVILGASTVVKFFAYRVIFRGRVQ